MGHPLTVKNFETAAFLGFENKTVTPYYQQANGMVEKFNTMLRIIIKSSKTLGEELETRDAEIFTELSKYATPQQENLQLTFYSVTVIPELIIALPDEDFPQ